MLLVIFLLYFFTVLSYNHVSVTEATTEHEDGFTINLIHRYSQESPFYNPSMSPLERFQKQFESSKSRYNQIKWLQNKVDTTTILTNDGDYLMTIYVGTPPTEIVLVLDTAVDLTWIQCAPCLTCYKQTVPIFNPYSSNTYETLPCDSRHCSNLDPSHINCDRDSDQCLYSYTFENHATTTRGVMGNDTFTFDSTFGENPSFPLTVFGCGFDQVGRFDSQSAGVASLGSGPISLVSQMGYKIDYKFSYCLSSNSYSNSKLRFGASRTIREGSVSLVTPFFTKYPASSYNLELYSISVGLGLTSIRVDTQITIDTASTLTYVTPSIFSNLETMINGAIGIKPMIINGLVESVLCYETISGVIIPPDIVFHLSGGDLVLEGTNVFFEYRGSRCLSIVSTPDEEGPLILGNMAQMNLEVEYDLLSRTVSFSQRDCALDI